MALNLGDQILVGPRQDANRRVVQHVLFHRKTFRLGVHDGVLCPNYAAACSAMSCRTCVLQRLRLRVLSKV
jgi:hypothetical protein